MDEHLTREQIAALLDEPDAAAEAEDRAHLDVCSECAGEFEAMSRTRMALSGMADLRAPDDGWEAIRARLPVSVTARRTVSATWWGRQERWGPVLTAAAILVLFLGGLGVGRVLAPGTSAGDVSGTGSESVALRDGEFGGPPRAGAEAEDPEYLRSVADLQELRHGGPSAEQISADPTLAAVRLTHLDALIEASREALREAPADPALNDFLFDVVDERTSVAGQLGRTIRQASMEY
jgi:hypothetical protein